MSLNLDSVEAKLTRAEHHAQNLRDEINPWMKTSPYSVTREVNADSTRYSLIAHLVKTPDLEKWSLIVGDTLHNLRSALDHLVYAIAVHESGKEPPPGERNLMFPIADTFDNFTKNRWRIESLSPDVQTAIESVQPYNRPHPGVPPPLGILRDLENTDKHKMLRLAYGAVSFGNVGFEGYQNSVENKAQIVTYGGEIQDGAEVLAFIFEKPEPNMKFDQVELDLIIALWHGKRDPADPPGHERNECNAVLTLLAEEVGTTVDTVKAAVK